MPVQEGKNKLSCNSRVSCQLLGSPAINVKRSYQQIRYSTAQCAGFTVHYKVSTFRSTMLKRHFLALFCVGLNLLSYIVRDVLLLQA